ncbi:hypothetical protein V6N13_092590 [Hibiscus sabdariffa]|uniref:Uncharacterized protein n=2 Tax=Hibiscus sabdariffa TaxID=183260 RepID=A0ABR2CCT1_9ROSI
MAAPPPPTAVGTRGTVGSLLKQEIDYFTKFELEPQGGGVGRSWRSHVQVEKDRSNSHSRPGFWFSITGWKRKKQRARNNDDDDDNGGFLPSMCSAIEVADMNWYSRISGFNYRILKNDIHNFHV